MDVINKIGRRKTAVARVYMSAGTGKMEVNGKDYKTYFPAITLQAALEKPFAVTNTTGQFDLKVNVDGGGITGQAEAVKLAISRALVESNAEYKPLLKVDSMLTRDPRMVERKKPGQKKARKRFQFVKR